MFSDTEYDSPPDKPARIKRRRTTRACDTCRGRKSKCDGEDGKKCTVCTEIGAVCTFVRGAPKRRGPRKGYSKYLEERLTRVETYLKKFITEAEFEKEFGPRDETFFHHQNGSIVARVYPEQFELTAKQREQAETADTIDDITESFSTMDLLHDNPKHYLGHSSAAGVVATIVGMQNEVTKSNHTLTLPPPYLDSFAFPWEITKDCDNTPLFYSFPPSNLFYELVDLYFDYYNSLRCLLHRPTFMQQIGSNLHLTDSSFGAITLIVCALGARYSNDPRVFAEEYNSAYTCGWKWFGQVQLLPDSTFRKAPSIFQLQFYVLAASFLAETTGVRACWMLLGLGIRLAQEIGADRKCPGPPTVESELLKRAWWCLVVQDRLSASYRGRSPAVKDEDFDVDLPVDCDDEYWEHIDVGQAFKQPADKPSRTTAFVETIELAQLLGTALKTLYCSDITKSSPASVPLRKNWRRYVLEELDSSLNAWSQNLPEHLRWNPDRTPDIHFRQSAAIHTLSHYLRTTIHRPFIPILGRTSSFPDIPSAAICSSAARSSIRILDVLYSRSGQAFPFAPGQAFSSAVILLLAAWSTNHASHTLIPRDQEDIVKAKKVIAASKSRWKLADLMLHSLDQLLSMSPGYGENAPNTEHRGRKRPLGENPGNEPHPPTPYHLPNDPLSQSVTQDGILPTRLFAPGHSYDNVFPQHSISPFEFSAYMNSFSLPIPQSSLPQDVMAASQYTGTGGYDWDAFLHSLAQSQDRAMYPTEGSVAPNERSEQYHYQSQ